MIYQGPRRLVWRCVIDWRLKERKGENLGRHGKDEDGKNHFVSQSEDPEYSRSFTVRQTDRRHGGLKWNPWS